MTQSIAILFLALAGLLGNLLVLTKWRKLRAVRSRNLTIAALICFGSTILFAIDLFTQVWVARPGAISGPMFLGSGFAFLGFSVAAVATLIASRRRHRHGTA